MKRIAIFVEGQTELIFVRKLLPLLFGYNDISYCCFKLLGDYSRGVPHNHTSPSPKLFFQLFDVGNDNRVLGEIKDRETSLFLHGYDLVIGLRDMYSSDYAKLTRCIDNEVIQKMIDVHNATISTFENADRIKLFFAIMEIEGWILSMYNLFIKINELLTVEYIEEHLNWNLKEINTETFFYHPAVNLGEVLNLTGITYNKSTHVVESIVSRIDVSDILEAYEENRCNSFLVFETFLEDLNTDN